MTLSRRALNTLLAGVPLAAALPGAWAQSRRDSVVLGMTLEPSPGLDPTTASAAAIGEIVHYNIFEGLTKVGMDGSVTPLLCESWGHTPDGKTYTFALKKGIKFSDGSAFDANAVKSASTAPAHRAAPTRPRRRSSTISPASWCTTRTR
jgi:peptide/nickel transport system substrate-binding protein